VARRLGNKAEVVSIAMTSLKLETFCKRLSELILKC